MKLKNKKTGEWCNFNMTPTEVYSTTPYRKYHYNSLAELNEEWEDYEEPKKHYEILAMGAVMEQEDAEDEIFRNQGQREIGNYFETKEEAEKAVEKLKAWKRLKNNGFRFDCYIRRSDWAGLSEVKALENLIDITAYLPKDKIKEMEADLDLLFGGEE